MYHISKRMCIKWSKWLLNQIKRPPVAWRGFLEAKSFMTKFTFSLSKLRKSLISKHFKINILRTSQLRKMLFIHIKIAKKNYFEALQNQGLQSMFKPLLLWSRFPHPTKDVQLPLEEVFPHQNLHQPHIITPLSYTYSLIVPW